MPGTEVQLQLAAVAFFAGLLLQVALVADSWKKTVALFVTAPVIFLLFYLFREEGEQLPDILGMSLVLFYLLVAVVLYRELLPGISGLNVLTYTLLAIYAIWTLLDGTEAPDWFWWIMLTPCALLLLMSFIPRRIPLWCGKLTYVWYLLMSMLLMVAQLQVAEYAELLESRGWGMEFYSGLFLLGMLSLHFVSSVVFLTSFLPHRWMDAWAEVHDFMARQISNESPALADIMGLLLYAAILAANAFYEKVPHIALIHALLFFSAERVFWQGRQMRRVNHEIS